MGKLTLKQQRFADEYIISGNAYQSAIKAGYTESYARGNVVKLLENVSVKSYIDKQLEELQSQKIADQEEVLEYLTSVLRGESRSETVVVEGVGDGCSQARAFMKAPDEKERTKAAELLGKRYRLFTDKVDVTQTGNIVIEVGDWDDEDE